MKELICIVCPRGCRLTVDENNDYAVTGNSCKRGEVYGMIKFGSRTELYLPIEGFEPQVRIGDAVKGGETVIAVMKPTDGVEK